MRQPRSLASRVASTFAPFQILIGSFSRRGRLQVSYSFGAVVLFLLSGVFFPRVAGATCTPTDCAGVGANCGETWNYCGGTQYCGTCSDGQTCGAGGLNVCGSGTCTPYTCAAFGNLCGLIPDGCGNILNCNGNCTEPDTCGATGNPYSCSCATVSCADLGANCGTQPDGCGGTQSCGGCSGDQNCGGTNPNQCGLGTCVPLTCQQLSPVCGYLSDGCGGILNCTTSDGGTNNCPPGFTCGGENVAYECGCQPATCAELSANCGTQPDNCGHTMNCGTCTRRTDLRRWSLQSLWFGNLYAFHMRGPQ